MPRHHEDTLTVPASPEQVFSFFDSPERLAGHMGKASWMMGGGRMAIDIDKGGGQTIGSHIRFSGTAFGVPISLDEVVTKRDPPSAKTWQTAGTPKLLVIGPYTMGFRLSAAGGGCKVSLFIDYEMPTRMAWLGALFGNMYARWCVRMMLRDVRRHFEMEKLDPRAH